MLWIIIKIGIVIASIVLGVLVFRSVGPHEETLTTLLTCAILMFGLLGWWACNSYEYDIAKYKSDIASIVQTETKKHPDSSDIKYDTIEDSSFGITEKTTELMMQKMNLKKQNVRVDVSNAGFGDPTLKYDEFEKTKNTVYCRVRITIHKSIISGKTCTTYVPVT